MHKKVADGLDSATESVSKAVGVPVDPDANDYEEICKRGPEFFARYCVERKEHQLGRALRPEEIADTRWRAEIKYSIIYDTINPSLSTQAMRHGAQFLDNLADLPFTMAEHMAVRMGANPAEVRGVRLLAEDALMITGAAGAARKMAQGVAKGVVKATAKKTAQTAATAEAAAVGAEARIGLKGRDYIRDMEKRSGIPISSKQRELLTDNLRDRKFTKLDKEAKISHGKEYSKVKDSLIFEWEKNTGNKWPMMEKISKKTGEIKVVKHDAHHIIPQEIGGPHKWWNMHPLEFGKHHQGGVHGKNSILKKIMKD